MAVISASILQGILDRMAKQMQVYVSASAVGTGDGKFFTRVDGSDDPLVEIALEPSAYALDTTQASYSFFANLFGGFITQIDSHLRNEGTTLDNYMLASGITAVSEFSTLYTTLTGRTLSSGVIASREVEL